MIRLPLSGFPYNRLYEHIQKAWIISCEKNACKLNGWGNLSRICLVWGYNCTFEKRTFASNNKLGTIAVYFAALGKIISWKWRLDHLYSNGLLLNTCERNITWASVSSQITSANIWDSIVYRFQLFRSEFNSWKSEDTSNCGEISRHIRK